VRPGDDAEFLGPDDAGEAHEIRDGVPVDSFRAGVIQIAKPLELRRHIREALKLGGGQAPLGRSDWGRKLGVVHGRSDWSGQKSFSEIWNWLTGDMGPPFLILKKSVFNNKLRREGEGGHGRVDPAAE
jgi:hypothetical protein